MFEKKITVCIGIPTYMRETILIETVRDVLDQNPPADEILVIDQTPEHEPETVNALKTWHDAEKIRWIHHSPPNLPGARNRALQETKCDIIIFIDDDVKLPDGFIGNHLKNYDDPKITAVGGRVIDPRLITPYRKKSWPQIMDWKFFSLTSEKRAEGVFRVGGMNHSLRTHAIKRIGGYDTNYVGWAYGEDADAAIRISKAGGMVVYDPSAYLIHLAFPTGGCRIKIKTKPIPEWQVSFPANYFAVRHLFPTRWFWYEVFVRNVRRFVLRKENFLKLWQMPWASVSYIYAILRSFKCAAEMAKK